ncbi:hypothetical protein [Crocinitomix algicola]|uniref:hypothetical protein n=1 Tax=Crocinitomix algicola TaxID=1740263 RepID=UPI000830F157|nr:hypothetical protein [Crocinitomix algicola]
MPANPKHLTKSFSQQFAKISAGVIGGYLLAALLHMSLVVWLPFSKEILVTSTITLFLLWCLFAILPFLFKNGWRAWGYYFVGIIILFVCFYLGDAYKPIF